MTSICFAIEKKRDFPGFFCTRHDGEDPEGEVIEIHTDNYRGFGNYDEADGTIDHHYYSDYTGTRLRTENCFKRAAVRDEVVKVLASRIRDNKTAENLILCFKNKSEDISLAFIGPAFAHNTSTKVLRIVSRSAIGAKKKLAWMAPLLVGLSAHPVLHSLDFSNVSFQYAESVALVELVASLASLRRLSVTGFIGKKMAEVFVDIPIVAINLEYLAIETKRWPAHLMAMMITRLIEEPCPIMHMGFIKSQLNNAVLSRVGRMRIGKRHKKSKLQKISTITGTSTVSKEGALIHKDVSFGTLEAVADAIEMTPSFVGFGPNNLNCEKTGAWPVPTKRVNVINRINRACRRNRRYSHFAAGLLMGLPKATIGRFVMTGITATPDYGVCEKALHEKNSARSDLLLANDMLYEAIGQGVDADQRTGTVTPLTDNPLYSGDVVSIVMSYLIPEYMFVSTPEEIKDNAARRSAEIEEAGQRSKRRRLNQQLV